VHGKQQPFNAHPMIPWKMTTVDLDCPVHLSRFARSLGVDFLEKIAVVDLLTVDGRMAGAIGFSLLDAKTYIFTATAVILANRNRNWRIMRVWTSGRGDGIAAAYRAGALMRNAEFGSFVNMVHTAHNMVSYGAEDHLYNAREGGGGAGTGAGPTPPGRTRAPGLINPWAPARRAGPSAARYAVTAERLPIDAAQAAALKKHTYEPLARSRGMTTSEMVWRVQNVMQPIKHSAWKHEDRLNEALGIVLRLKEKLPALVAADAHYLSAANECRSMVLAAEMFYRACLARKESRGWFIREDYPNRDDRNMLKWIVLQKEGDRMNVSYEDVPMARYKHQPEGFPGSAVCHDDPGFRRAAAPR
jgi:succinate dehydrogenase/fumarate reductase flavoprotein subunit